MPVQSHLLQTLVSLSSNWIIQIEFKTTIDTLDPIHSSLFRVLGNEGKIAWIDVQDSTTLSINDAPFQPKKDVYHRVVFSQIFSPTHNGCLKELRIDGQLYQSYTHTKSYTNVNAYAGWPSAPASQTNNVMIRNFYLLDLDKDEP